MMKRAAPHQGSGLLLRLVYSQWATLDGVALLAVQADISAAIVFSVSKAKDQMQW